MKKEITGDARMLYKYNALQCNFIPEICALLGYYAASISNPLPTFRDNVSVPFQGSISEFLLGLLDP
jgi:hypothetical protein